MTDISAKIIADSLSPEGVRLTTLQLRYPRFIHAESKTHRVINESGEVIEEIVSPGLMNDPNLSRNARSSRAVPVEKMIQEIIDNPVIPIHWGAAQKGMQAYQENDALVDVGAGADLKHSLTFDREDAWLYARDQVVGVAKAFHAAGYHKQVINRLLEPWMHIDTLVTATEWTNFFALRDHHAAEPHIQVLAREMKEAMHASMPQYLAHGAWHLPYVDLDRDTDRVLQWLRVNTTDAPEGNQIYDVLIKLSVARCARISYRPFDGDGTIDSEINRYNLLVGSHPLHASPAEHQATPDRKISVPSATQIGGEHQWAEGWAHGNFVGWIQYRKTIPGENITELAA